MPAIALFASKSRYVDVFCLARRKKREAYRRSEFAPQMLAQHGINAIMKMTVARERHQDWSTM
ncbi:hypothetical protein DEU56DRAFT_837624 [Suillus clintonianus]|uniref:uncharacterized protein n=1 Tax=Suillus clintonianus TaxID=1904413 RepID=UPI001B861CFA|nr:uncharacterized protein DEU56DRAFT_837624 [Suillus clintonianus]KAG2118642.1 hypothetical protein DEU56DRAFT_837624 [Suillus clintonianus]